MGGWTPISFMGGWPTILLSGYRPSDRSSCWLMAMALISITTCRYFVTSGYPENILWYRLPPPHTSHALQPTDRGYFASFKSTFKKGVGNFTLEYPGISITKWTFPTIFTRSFEKSCRNDVIKSSFRCTGIWPVNRLAVDHQLFNPAKLYKANQTEQNTIESIDFNVSDNDNQKQPMANNSFTNETPASTTASTI